MMDFDRFNMVDKINTISVEQGTIETQTIVPTDSSFLDNHFPSNPIVPGVLLIEVMAQSSGNLAMAKLEFTKMAVLASVSHCKFFDFVMPGDILTCSAKLLSCKRGFSVNEVNVYREDEVVAMAELRMKIIDFFCDFSKEKIISNFNVMLEKNGNK